MLDRFSRTQLLYGEKTMGKLASSRVAVFGIGGVGGYVVEALARSGIGALDLIDNDKVCLTNINRQIIATEKSTPYPPIVITFLLALFSAGRLLKMISSISLSLYAYSLPNLKLSYARFNS